MVLKESFNKKTSSLETILNVERYAKDWSGQDITYFEQFASENENVQKGLNELSELTSYLDGLNVLKNCSFNPFLARGLDIYTGTIYEIFLSDQSISSSIGSGGRYDSAIGGLLGSEESFSTVGISFGLDVIFTALKERSSTLVKDERPDYVIIPIEAKREALIVASAYRKLGYRIEVDMSEKRIGKSLERANKRGIEKVMLIGNEEVNRNEIIVKLLNEGTEKSIPFRF